MCLAGGRKRQCAITGWAKGYTRLRENAEGHFIGDTQYCKNFQSSNRMLLISRLIDQPWTVISISFRYLDYDFSICIYYICTILGNVTEVQCLKSNEDMILALAISIYYFKFHFAYRQFYCKIIIKKKKNFVTQGTDTALTHTQIAPELGPYRKVTDHLNFLNILVLRPFQLQKEQKTNGGYKHPQLDNAWSNKHFLYYLTFRTLQHTSSELNGYNCYRHLKQYKNKVGNQ